MRLIARIRKRATEAPSSERGRSKRSVRLWLTASRLLLNLRKFLEVASHSPWASLFFRRLRLFLAMRRLELGFGSALKQLALITLVRASATFVMPISFSTKLNVLAWPQTPL